MRTWTRAVRTAAAACVLLGSALLGAAPAGAAGARAGTPTLRFAGGNVYYVSTTIQPAGLHNEQLPLRLSDSDDTGVPGRITVDATALAGKVTVADVPDNCTRSGLVVTCREWMDKDVRDYPFALTAAPGAPIGFTADVLVTAETTGGPHAAATTRVHTVIGTPDLRVRDVPTVTGVHPGDVVRDPLVVENRGQVAPLGGFVLWGASDVGLDPAGKVPRNCLYREGVGAAGHTPYDFWCTFTRQIPPGAAYAVDTPIALRARPELTSGTVTYMIPPAGTDLAVTAWSDDEDFAGPPSRGTGPALGMHLAGSGGAGPGDGARVGAVAGTFRAVADQQADYRAVGATVHGTVGQVVRFTLSVRNDGPGSMAGRPVGDTGLDVTPPPGTTVLSLHQGDPEEVPNPWWCSPRHSGASVYHCGMGPQREGQLAPGQAYEVDVTLRVDKAVAGARGSVRVRRTSGEDTHDGDTADDVAPIVLVVPGGTADAASHTWLPAAAAAALAVVLGGAATAAVRRRTRRTSGRPPDGT